MSYELSKDDFILLEYCFEKALNTTELHTVKFNDINYLRLRFQNAHTAFIEEE